MTRAMYDSINVDAIPRDAQMVAGYVDGAWPTWTKLVQLFSGIKKVSITVSATNHNAHVLDVEKGDASPSDAPSWATECRQLGIIPTVYCDLDTWPEVIAAFRNANIIQPNYWIAHYGATPIIPGGAIALQYDSTSEYDISVVADYWPGVDPLPGGNVATLDSTDLSNIKQQVVSAISEARATAVADTLYWLAVALKGTAPKGTPQVDLDSIQTIHEALLGLVTKEG